MKKKLFTLFLVYACIGQVSAQLIKNDFMDDIAIGEAIEKGYYTADGQPIKQNQWNFSGWAGVTQEVIDASPKATEPLTYSGYIDSGHNNSFTLLKRSSGSRFTGYSLTDTGQYNEGDYYLSFLIRVHESTGEHGIIAFDANHTIRFQRVVLFAKPTNGGTQFNFGLSRSQDNTTSSSFETTARNYSTTYLIVMKINMDTGAASLFINPDISIQEPASTVSLTIDLGTGEYSFGTMGIRGITAISRATHSATVGSFRLAKDYSSISGLTTISEIQYIGDKYVVNEELFTLTGTKINIPQTNGFYVRKVIYQDGSVGVNKYYHWIQ